MQLLESVHLVQFFLFEAETLRFDRTTAVIAPNGAGKSALLDALQIVLLGGDRNRIRFNAQAGGSSKARTIRDYCLGVYRSGEEGRKRRTATTFITLVFRDEDSGQPLTAGIALGASADEADHRIHGLFIAPGVALELNDHLERVKGKDLPLAFPAFKELLQRKCRSAGTKHELHTSSERFIKDLLLRLRGAPNAFPDANAYRKAFQNALNLQKQEDIDLWVRTLVAEDRPTDIARFRSLLDTFRQIKDKIQQVARRIDAAEVVQSQYNAIEKQAVRAASYRALRAEYARDLLAEQVEAAEASVEQSKDSHEAIKRKLFEAQQARESTAKELSDARMQQQGISGFSDQASFDALASRDRETLQSFKGDLLREFETLRASFKSLANLELPGVDPTLLTSVLATLQGAFDEVAALKAGAALPWTAEQIHNRIHTALVSARPLLDTLAARTRERDKALEAIDERIRVAEENKRRLSAGKAELSADTYRLQAYLRDKGIEAEPVCDLVKVTDPDWQASIEAYLRSNIEALLIPLAQEESAVQLYRALRGNQSVYGVKLALTSHARERVKRPDAGSVAELIAGNNADATAFLRRQLGDLRCVETEAELLRSKQGLTKDGLLAKGGSIERRRLPSASEFKIGSKDNRTRQQSLQTELESARLERQQLKPLADSAAKCWKDLVRVENPESISEKLHRLAVEHAARQESLLAAEVNRNRGVDPDLLRLSEIVGALETRQKEQQSQTEQLIGDERESLNTLARFEALLTGLKSEESRTAALAVESFRDPDVDPARVERQREDLDGKFETLEARIERCEVRARDSEKSYFSLIPDAWKDLQQYGKDFAIQTAFANDDWRSAAALLQKELDQLRETELVRYEADAERAYGTATETFRANVASTLFDNFSKLKHQINRLNRTLHNSPAFSNNERYKFHFEVVPEFKELHAFITRAAELQGEDNLFGSAGEIPHAFRELMDDSISLRPGASALDDYRRFYRFEVQIRQDERVIGTLSERMRSGSGGEHRAPLYVIAGAALAAAYGKSETSPGGLGLIMLDEFGDKIDAQNARATTDYLRSLGLQLLLAAPDTAQGTLSGVMDSYIELFRDGDLIQVERVEISEAARDLLQSDQFDVHPALLAEEIARLSGGALDA